jgi:tripartite-type tricarboxylate transporter receptor subunit TctC
MPIGPTAHSPAVIVARKDFPARDLVEFVAVLRQKGSAYKQAHGGVGASSHMACLLLTRAIGVSPTLVAYRGTGPAMNDLIGGFCEQSISVMEQIAAGTIKAYATSGSERLASLPNVPTAREVGIDYQMSIWAGMFAPAGTPAPVIRRLADALDQSLDQPNVRKRINDLGGTIPDKAERSPAAFDRYVRAEIVRWAPILTAAVPAAQ